MTSSWDTIITQSGQVLTSSVFNQTQENIKAATEQMSGAPHARLPYFNTTSRSALSVTRSASVIIYNPDIDRYEGYSPNKQQWEFISKNPFLGTTSRDAWSLNGSDAAIIFNPDVQQYEGYNPLNGEWGTIGGGKSFITILSSGHGYTESGDTGKPLYWAGSYMQSDASTPNKADVLGLLSKVIDINQFEIQQTGPITLDHSRWNDVFSGGIVQGEYYWLQGSGLGTYVDCAPALDGWVDKPVIYAITSAEALILNLRGAEIGGSYARQKSFTVTDVESNIVRFEHNFGTAQPAIFVFNNNNERVAEISSYEPTSGNPLNSTDVIISSAYMVDVGSTVWQIKGVGTGAKTVVNLSDQIPLSEIDSAQAGDSEEAARYNHQHKAPRRTSALWADVTTYGSVDDKILRFTTQIESSNQIVVSITENSSSATTITANMKCMVWFDYSITFGAPDWMGISKNSNQLTTKLTTINSSHRMKSNYLNGADLVVSALYFSEVNSGDVLRPHTDGAAIGSSTDQPRLNILAIEIPE